MTISATAVADPLAGLPAAVRLTPTFDTDRLQAEVGHLTRLTWARQRTYTEQGEGLESPVDWRVLALRNQGGDEQRTDAGGPGTAPFTNTRWLDSTPYLAEVLASLPRGMRAARLMSLAPGAQVGTHRDTPMGLPYGMVRLHIPIVTNDGAVLVLDGDTHCWKPGTFWYGDFSRPHSIANSGPSNRIHLVIDTALTPELLDLFPRTSVDRIDVADVLFERPELPLRPGELASFRGRVTVPAAFANWSAEPLDDTVSIGDQHSSIVAEDGRLVLVGPDARIGLVHVGAGEFRLQGWTEERTMHIDRRAEAIRFTIRNGSCWWTEQSPFLAGA